MKMRYLASLVLVTSLLSALVLGDTNSSGKEKLNPKDRMSPERTQCIESCKKEKDTAAHETCLNACPKDHRDLKRSSERK